MSENEAKMGEHHLERELGMWRPMETAPKDGSRVLAWCEQYHAPTTMQYYRCVNEWMIDYDLGPMLYQPTHWMPLPKPPTSA